MIELTGTEKQVNWATELRTKAMADNFRTSFLSRRNGNTELLAECVEYLGTIRNAAWWIQNKDRLSTHDGYLGYAAMQVLRSKAN